MMKMFFWFLRFLFLPLFLWGFSAEGRPQKPPLKILTYSSFAGVLGPGRIIQQKFESFCECRVQWFLAEDSTALRQRLAMVSGIDIVIGWDQITLKTALSEKWEDISRLKNQQALSFLPDLLQDPHFLPLNWSPIGFLRKDKPPAIFSLKSLHKTEGLISFPEPYSSSLGLQLYYWIYEILKGDKKQIAYFLKQLNPKVYGPLSSWSLSYGVFQKGKTQLGLSYLSSLIYHQKEGESYFFSYFKEGHPYQMEFLSIPKNSKNKKLALKLAQFLLSSEIQKLLLETHYMFPVSRGWDHKLLKRKIKWISYNKIDQFMKEKPHLLKLWKENLY